MMGGYGMMAGMSMAGMLASALVVLIVVALVIWGFMTLLRAPRSPGEPDAQELLKRRLAHGEITREEYEQVRAALR